MSGSKKRSASSQAAKGQAEPELPDELEFEDPYGDDVEEEGEDEEVIDGESEPIADAGSGPVKQVWRPGIDKVEDGAELEYDPSAYIMYHSMSTEWPCLSFDFVRDTLGDNRHRFPLTAFMVTGSQADRSERNKITLLKLSDLHKTHVKDSDDEASDDDDDDDHLDEDPTIEHMNVNHVGGVNRIRSMPQSPGIIATMAETGHAHVFDLAAGLNSMMGSGPRAPAPSKPIFSYTGHAEEGYAMDWNPVVAGRMVTGDNDGKIRLWNPSAAGGGSWQVDSKPFCGHTSSVEDLQWSPTEGTVFASASADHSVRIWDVRDNSKAQIAIDAHTDDVNVISWNKNVGYLLASGCDDGSFKVWDLRAVKKGCTPLAHFTYHHEAITSIEWASNDESVIALTCADNQLTVWDLSVEADDSTVAAATAAQDPMADYPPQLLFIHQGQFNMKELHFHPQIPGVIGSTAENGFNFFKPAITVSS
jgi:ribosome assembly protein RRB1